MGVSGYSWDSTIKVDRDYFHDNASGFGTAQLLKLRRYRMAAALAGWK
jgi:hypothetical protein